MTRTVLAYLLAALAVLFVSGGAAEAASRAKIDRRVNEALAEFRDKVRGSDAVLSRAHGVLVFPKITKGGFGVGAEYGEGALRIGGKSVAYYSTASGSIGFQIGLQGRRQILVFLDKEALDKFRNSENWKVGVDGSVTVITVGAGGEVDSQTINQPVVAFIFDSKGLMYNLSLEGSKISRINPK